MDTVSVGTPHADVESVLGGFPQFSEMFRGDPETHHHQNSNGTPQMIAPDLHSHSRRARLSSLMDCQSSSLVITHLIPNMTDLTPWTPFLNSAVVLDLASPYVVLGTVTAVNGLFVTLADADVHDLRDSKTTRELYVLEARRHGIRSNRQQTSVRINEIVSLSRLDDVIE
jgi:hypothetical protein